MFPIRQTQIGIPLPAPTPRVPIPVEAPSGPKLPQSDLGEHDDDITRTEDARPKLDTSPGIGEGRRSATREAIGPRESREEVHAMIRATVAEGVASVLGETQRLIGQLERRIDELERRPVTAVATAVAPATAAALGSGAGAHATPRVQVPHYVPAAAPVVVSAAPRQPVFDVAAIERSVHIDIDSAFDGGRRKRRILLLVTFFFLALFAALFTLLAQSYSPQN
jgi:hypothetical protein